MTKETDFKIIYPQMKHNYELVVVLDSEVKTEEQEELLTKIKKFITSSDSQIDSIAEWGKKELTFPIKKKTAGMYYLFNLSIEADKVAPLKQKLQNEDKVIRYLLTKVEEKSQTSEKKSSKSEGEEVK